MQEYQQDYKWIKSCAPAPRTFTLKNIYTNELIQATNITKFCEENNMPRTAGFSISNLLGGRLLKYRQYTLPETQIKIPDLMKIKDLNTGKVFSGRTKIELSKKTGLSTGQIRSLFKSSKMINGYVAVGSKFKPIQIKNTETGQIYSVLTPLSQFCETHGINHWAISGHGKWKHWIMLNTDKAIFRYKIKNVDTNEVFEVLKLKDFCQKHGLPLETFYHCRQYKNFVMIERNGKPIKNVRVVSKENTDKKPSIFKYFVNLFK